MSTNAASILASAPGTFTVSSSVDPKRPGSISGAARQFEAVLLGQWLQAAQTSFASAPGGPSDTDAGCDQVQEMAVQQLATALASRGGIGIGKMVAAALERASASGSGTIGPTPSSRNPREGSHAS